MTSQISDSTKFPTSRFFFYIHFSNAHNSLWLMITLLTPYLSSLPLKKSVLLYSLPYYFLGHNFCLCMIFLYEISNYIPSHY